MSTILPNRVQDIPLIVGIKLSPTPQGVHKVQQRKPQGIERECRIMTSTIYSMNERAGIITKKAVYTLPAKKALVCYIEQYLNNNWNDWTYPNKIQGMRESIKIGARGFYYDDFKNNAILQSVESL